MAFVPHGLSKGDGSMWTSHPGPGLAGYKDGHTHTQLYGMPSYGVALQFPFTEPRGLTSVQA